MASPREFSSTSHETYKPLDVSGEEEQQLSLREEERRETTRKLLDEWFPDHIKNTSEVHRTFTNFMVAVICLQSIQIGAQIQWKAEDHPILQMVYKIGNAFFLVCYVTEVVWKVKEFGWMKYIWTGDSPRWDMLDFGLTTIMLLQTILESACPRSMSNLLSALRILTILRMFRLIKVLRNIRQLAIVVGGVTGSISALGWIFALLALLVYFFSIFFTEAVPEGIFEDRRFADVFFSMQTLTDMVMGGTWGDVINPIIDQRVVLLPFFFLFITMASFGLLNLIVGVICDATSDTKSRLEYHLNRQKLWGLSEIWLQTFYSDGLDTETISKCTGEEQEKMKKLRKNQILEVLQGIIDDPDNDINFPPGVHAKDIFEMLDPEGKNTLNHMDFVTGMGLLLLGDDFQLNVDTQINQGRTRRILRNQEIRRDQRFEKIEGQLGNIQNQVGKMENSVGDRLGKIEQQLATLGKIEQQMATLVAKSNTK